jgi:catechol 2,3-dioxygenase-like lactoylglutathione lyase family enzyme
MRRLWTIIGVADVNVSFRWYQSLLGLPNSVPAHDYFGQIVDPDGTVLLSLHEWGAHEHPSLASPHPAAPGNGVLLFFRVDNFDDALSTARDLVGQLAEEPRVNPNTRSMEFSLRDPDGYYVTVSALKLSAEDLSMQC